ncbi:anhydro-N-acetylmuramic acid kinase [Cesiribacter andamanensis]|uniref:Anhydro-N-acetylmuramic acid kinase n=1 Tax=Cesiribacter andamanensis AMV16 TaxID=1279009 RepID=M7N909_9BACT|nr:anhydro-N-acetylmuramic acid kinase [Cesiribacter andamanensis]EMR03737.1 Anhydro-N-acetylmuramic acid kinase [Cesiribacter andamanensis AMV16]
MINSYTLLGAMSGTSLDGLDLACCHFTRTAAGKWDYTVLAAETISYTEAWQQRLAHLMQADALTFVKTDRALGRWMGEQVRQFMNRHHVQPQAVASHGHTVFHQPEEGLTVQIGSGVSMMAACGIPVINDFRSLDVALGGHGAPLVPIGDQLLFSDYDFCLNLGGIANISAQQGASRIAYDVCPANGVLNYLARRMDQPYDPDGRLAASGQLLPGLLQQLNALPYYALPGPKSLGYEWVEAEALPLIASTEAPVPDLLYTVCEHIAQQITLSARQLMPKGKGEQKKLLATGGGAFNKHLIDRIDQHLAPFGIEVVLPDAQTIAFKEALIFAFLGVLRLRNEPNCLSSVTGARSDSSGGVIYDNIL